MVMLIPFNAVIAMKTRAYQVGTVRTGHGCNLLLLFSFLYQRIILSPISNIRSTLRRDLLMASMSRRLITPSKTASVFIWAPDCISCHCFIVSISFNSCASASVKSTSDLVDTSFSFSKQQSSKLIFFKIHWNTLIPWQSVVEFNQVWNMCFCMILHYI